MLELLAPVLLARIQFAFTTSLLIIFPAFTRGLASWLAVVEKRVQSPYLRRKSSHEAMY